ncbi:hypothetical protein ACROYT_G006099 [Oculina patagonica]
MSSANVLPSAPAYGDREETQLYPSLPTNAENFRLTEISKIEKEISAEAEHYRLVLKKYKKVRKVIHYSVVCLGAVTAALSSGAVATSLTGVGIVIGVPVAAVADAPQDQLEKKVNCERIEWKTDSAGQDQKLPINQFIQKFTEVCEFCFGFYNKEGRRKCRLANSLRRQSKSSVLL